jgi:hypothetical protein
MTISTFVALTGKGIARAERGNSENWSVEHLLPNEDVRCIIANPVNRDVLYVGTQGNGILQSRDSGKTWQLLGLNGQIVKSLAISKARPATIYAGCKPPMLFVSHDEGKTWSELESFRKRRQWWWFTPAETPFNQPYVHGLTVSPTNPNVILAGIEYGAVLRSEDGGATWSTHCKRADRDCHSLTFHASDGNWAYEGGGTSATFSKDGGQTWQGVENTSYFSMMMEFRGKPSPDKGLDRHYGWAVAADPQDPNIWYYSASFGPMYAHAENGNAQAHIFRCKDGLRFEKLSGGLPSPLPYMPYALVTDPDAAGHLYAGMSNGNIWQTQDYGDSWVQLPVNVGSIHRSMIGL